MQYYRAISYRGVTWWSSTLWTLAWPDCSYEFWVAAEEHPFHCIREKYVIFVPNFGACSDEGHIGGLSGAWQFSRRGQADTCKLPLSCTGTGQHNSYHLYNAWLNVFKLMPPQRKDLKWTGGRFKSLSCFSQYIRFAVTTSLVVFSSHFLTETFLLLVQYNTHNQQHLWCQRCAS